MRKNNYKIINFIRNVKKCMLIMTITGCTLLFTGCSFEDAKSSYRSFIKDVLGDNYYKDVELEAASLKNSQENGTIIALKALDLCKTKYASMFEKKYFSSEDEGYLYYMKSQNVYLAIRQIVKLQGKDFYEIIMFEEMAKKERDIKNKYYVDAHDSIVYDEANKPEENKIFYDNGLRLKVFLPKNFENNIVTNYMESTHLKIKEKDVEVRVINFLYQENNITNKLFDIVIFDEVFEKDMFNVSSEDAMSYYIGTNNDYTYCLNKAVISDEYTDNAKKILLEELNYIIENIQID